MSPADSSSFPPLAPAHAPAITLAERGAAAASRGDIAQARCAITEALRNAPTDLRVLFLAFQFHFRIGELDEAERLVRLRLAVAGPEADSEHAAHALGNLGLVLHHRGELDEAERTLTRAIEMDTRLGHEHGIARDTGNLAAVHESRGDLDTAETLYHSALALAERIGADEIIATKLSNLGDIAIARAQPEKARAYWIRAVALLDKTGSTKWRDEYARRLGEIDQHPPPPEPSAVSSPSPSPPPPAAARGAPPQSPR